MTLREFREQIANIPYASEDDPVFVCLDLGGANEVITLEVMSVGAVDCEPDRRIEVWIDVDTDPSTLLREIARAIKPAMEE